MKNVDLSNMKKMENYFIESSQKIKESYMSEWDDEIHDSYKVFVNGIFEFARNYRKISNNILDIEKEIDKKNIADIIKKSEMLIGESKQL